MWSLTEYESDYDRYESKKPCAGGSRDNVKGKLGKQSGRYVFSMNASQFR